MVANKKLLYWSSLKEKIERGSKQRSERNHNKAQTSSKQRSSKLSGQCKGSNWDLFAKSVFIPKE